MTKGNEAMNDDDNGLTFVVAALFHAARLSRPATIHDELTPQDSIQKAKAFCEAAKAAGVNPPNGD